MFRRTKSRRLSAVGFLVAVAGTWQSHTVESFSGIGCDTHGTRYKGKPSFLNQQAKEDDVSEVDNERKSWDGYTMYTKTNKRLVFDEESGRFFETTGDPLRQGKQVVTSSARSMYVSELPIINYDKTKYSPDDMIPTEELFSRRPPARTAAERELSILDLECMEEECDVVYEVDYADTVIGPVLDQRYEIFQNNVLQCYDAWDRRDMGAAVGCFDEVFTYRDGQVLGSFTKKSELQRHFTQQADVLPSGSRLVVDLLAVDPAQGQIAAEWHVEAPSSSTSGQAVVVPFTRGISFYNLSLCGENSKISSGYRVSEMVIKTPQNLVNSLVESVSGLLKTIPSRRSGTSHFRSEEKSLPKSIIHEYFEAWNERDMEAALSCFVDDCVYQTEDPVFVDTFHGKTALRKHLEKNAAVLPPNCRIELEQVCIDPINGNIGTTWYMKEGDRAIPNLRGCSMYTTDRTTGLLTTGYDVTEAPVKVPRQATSLLSIPAKRLFNAKH
eukprot:scaffold1667_cov173-Amphora_coffeaeformis.AAC.2